MKDSIIFKSFEDYTEWIENSQESKNFSSIKKLTLKLCLFSDIPNNFYLFANLEILILNSSFLFEFPKSILELKNLKELYIYGNHIKEIPQEIKKLSKLELLHLGHNELKEIPDFLLEMQNLKYLYMEYCFDFAKDNKPFEKAVWYHEHVKMFYSGKKIYL